jgi:hypothetical protein
MRLVPWHDALLAIENDNVVLLLVGDDVPSKLLTQRIRSISRIYSERGFLALSVKVDEDCAVHPELAAVRLPQIRVFTSGEETKRLIGVQEEDELEDLIPYR